MRCVLGCSPTRSHGERAPTHHGRGNCRGAGGTARRSPMAGRCPIHGGRSLLVRDGDAGGILVFRHGGCEGRDVLAELRRSGLPGGPSKSYQLPPTRRNDRPDEAARTASALAVWRETRPANGTIVETYRANRGL